MYVVSCLFVTLLLIIFIFDLLNFLMNFQTYFPFKTNSFQDIVCGFSSVLALVIQPLTSRRSIIVLTSLNLKKFQGIVFKTLEHQSWPYT